MTFIRVERVDADHLRLTLGSETLLTNEDWESLRRTKAEIIGWDHDNMHFIGTYVCYREVPPRECFLFSHGQYEELLRIFKGPAL